MALTRRLFTSLFILAANVGMADAHGPTPQKISEKISIAAPPADVWKAIKDFGAIATWHPGLEKSVGEGGNAPGATRTITLKSGGELVDSLDDIDEKAMSLGYRLQKENTDAFPVSFYSDLITVQPASVGSEIEWIARFYRADTTNEPPANKNDEAAVKATTDFIKAGLAGLKAKLESKP